MNLNFEFSLFIFFYGKTVRFRQALAQNCASDLKGLIKVKIMTAQWVMERNIIDVIL